MLGFPALEQRAFKVSSSLTGALADLTPANPAKMTAVLVLEPFGLNVFAHGHALIMLFDYCTSQV